LVFSVQGGLFEVLYLRYVVVSSVLEEGDIYGQDEMDIGDSTGHFSNFFKDDMVIPRCLNYASEED
jgi:hypothetical protein